MKHTLYIIHSIILILTFCQLVAAGPDSSVTEVPEPSATICDTCKFNLPSGAIPSEVNGTSDQDIKTVESDPKSDGLSIDSNPEVLVNKDSDSTIAHNPIEGIWSVNHRKNMRDSRSYVLIISPTNIKNKYKGVIKYSKFKHWKPGEVKAHFYESEQGYSANWSTNKENKKMVYFQMDSRGNLTGQLGKSSTLIMRPLSGDMEALLKQKESHKSKNVPAQNSEQYHPSISVGIQFGQINYSGLTSKYFSRKPLGMATASICHKRFMVAAKVGATYMESKKKVTNFKHGSLKRGEGLMVTIGQLMMGIRLSPANYLDFIPQVGLGIAIFDADDDPIGDDYDPMNYDGYDYISISPIGSYVAGYTVRTTRLKIKKQKIYFEVSGLYSSTQFDEIGSVPDMGKGYVTYMVGAGLQF